jgi:hypothetical protein
MRLRDQIRRPWHWLQRKRLAKKLSETPLREFVYLDDVSVYSLVASRKGPIATDYRDTASTLLRSEIEGTAGVAAGLAKSEVSARVESSQTNELQIVRKAIIQSTFRELYEAEKGKLPLSARDVGHLPEPPRDIVELSRVSSRPEAHGWLIEADELKRGQLIEIEVELQAEDIFGFSTTVSSVLEMIQDSELLSAAGPQDTRQIIAVNQILQRLLVGLIPLRGRAAHHTSVVIEGREFLAHERLLSKVKGDIETRPLFIVGVAEEQLFWKDIRRVLFGRSRYVVLCRLGKDGLQTQWSPVKLVDVLRDVAPELANGIDEAVQSLRTFISSGAEPISAMDARSPGMRQALSSYGVAVAARYGQQCTIDELNSSGPFSDECIVNSEPLEARRQAFRAVTDYVAARFGIEVDPQVATELRQRALEEAGLWPFPGSTVVESRPAGGVNTQLAGPTDGRYLDAEIVAIYW